MGLLAHTELFAVGVVAGALGALLGVGGGMILVPGLALVAGLPFRGAVAASLVCVVATSVAGSIVHLRYDRVVLPVALELQFFTVAGAVGAGLIAEFLPAGPLYFAFALLLVYGALEMWPRATLLEEAVPPPHGPQTAWARAASLSGGIVSALLGVGGGVVFTPVLHLLLRQPFHRAAATSVYMIGVTSAAGALVYLARGDVDPWVAGPAMLGVLAGAATAASWGHLLDHRWLKVAFAALLLVIAAQMVRRGLAQL